MAQAKRDQNRVPTLLAVSDVDSVTPLVIEGDATTAGLNINIVGDDVGVGGTQYTEGDTDASITGTAVMWEDGSDTLRSVSSAKPLPISVASLPLPSSAATSAKQLADGHAVTIDNIISNEVYVRGSQSAGSPVDGEVVTIQGITGADAVTVGGTIAATNTSLIGPGDPTIDSYTQFAINLGAAANQVLVSSAANKQIWVYSVAYTCSVAGTVSFQDEDDTAITGIMDHAANSGLAVGASGNFAMPIWKLATDKDLEVDVVTASIDGWISYAIVSV